MEFQPLPSATPLFIVQVSAHGRYIIRP